MSYSPIDSELAARQLEAQVVCVSVNAVAGSSDLPSNVAIDNSTIATTAIVLSVNEVVKKCFSVKVINRATGAVVPLLAAPSLSVAKKVSISVNGTGLTDLAVEFTYAVA